VGKKIDMFENSGGMKVAMTNIQKEFRICPSTERRHVKFFAAEAASSAVGRCSWVDKRSVAAQSPVSGAYFNSVRIEFPENT
jgi:hypothetical protein